ncbi:TIGR02234 family membrane protein [Streptomyces luteireticuli]|uniref:TIGR02234 family membrane protein n=1 Tax=Streptomyces luteireticuli TaxID=173858 RepID=A0ABN0YRW1_9ACTN
MSAAVPHPRPQPDETRPGRSARRSVGAALVLTAAGSALVLLAGGRTWLTGSAEGAQNATVEHVTGQDISGVPGALAIVALAALVAVFAVRGVARTLVAALLALCGAGTAVLCLLNRDDTAALEERASRSTGLASTAVEHVTHSSWPWVTLAGGVLILLAGLLALRHGRHWPAMSGRYERDGTPRPRRTRKPADPERPEELWKAFDRGEDPTGEATPR